MSKMKRCIDLIGLDKNMSPARIGTDVHIFANLNKSVQIRKTKTGDVLVSTHKGKYVLKAHPSIENVFTGVLANDIKCRFSKKKITAKLVYWA